MQDTIENLEGEIWRDIAGYEGHYKVSNLGNVYSIKSKLYLKLHMTGSGYLTIKLSINGNASNIKVHRLVALAFIPNPENKRTVNHINGIRNDNRLQNLEWSTHSENGKHSFMFLGRVSGALGKKGFDSKTSKSVRQISLDGMYINIFGSMAEAERYTGICSANISCCCLGKRKLAGGYKWEFAKGIER